MKYIASYNIYVYADKQRNMSDSHTKQKKSEQKTREKTKDKVSFNIRQHIAT